MCVRIASAALALFILSAPPAMAGCGTPPPEVPPAAVDVDGTSRDIIAAVPPDYGPVRPHTLIVAFHGRTNSNAEVRRYYGLERNAREPTIVVYPAGTTDRSGRYAWNVPADFKLFDRIVDTMSELYCVDRERVFVAGHSLGASFANTLACARGAAIRGVATVGGGIGAATGCSGPVAALILHNPRDRLVPIGEGLRVRNARLAQNGFAPASNPILDNRFNCRRYGPDGAKNPVVWCPHADDLTRRGRFYPHQWQEGTGATIMTFFAALEGDGASAALP